MDEYESLDREQAADVVGQQGDRGEPGEPGAATEAAGEKSSDNAERSAQAQQQSHEDNRRYQAARHSGEQSGYERAYREFNARIARTGMRNPESGDVIRSIEDLEGFSVARKKEVYAKIAKDTGRTVGEVEEEEENKAFLSNLRRNAAEKDKADRQAEREREFIRKDALAFAQAFPEVDLGQLDQDKAFRRFCGSRYGKEPLAELYADYLEIAGSAAQAARVKADSKAGRTTGTGNNGGGETLTAAQQRDLDEWNRENPGMKMTAKEFLER